METLFSVWWDVAQAKADAVTGTAERSGTSEVSMEPGCQGQGRVQGPWDFWSELAARLAAGVDGGPLCVSPVTRPEPGIRTGFPVPDTACPDGTNVSTAPACEANVSPAEAGEATGKPRTKPGAPEARQPAPESWPDDACLAWLPEKAKPSKAERSKAKPSLQAAPECLIREAQAADLMARSTGVGAATPETEEAASIRWDVVSTRALPAPQRTPTRSIAAAVPVFGAGHPGPGRLGSGETGLDKAHVRRVADGSLQAGAARASLAKADAIAGAAAGECKGRVGIAEHETPPPGETTLPHGGDAGVGRHAAGPASQDGPNNATEVAAIAGGRQVRQVSLSGTGVSQVESARGEAAVNPTPADRGAGEETGRSAGWREGTTSPAEGTTPTAPADLGRAAGRIVVREGPVAAGASAGAGLEESLRAAACPGPSERISGETDDSGAHGRSRVVGVRTGIVPRSEGSTGATRAEQQGRAEATGASPRDPRPAFRPAERPASTVFRETRPLTLGRMEYSILDSSSTAGLEDGETPVVPVDGRTDAVAGPRLEDPVMLGTRMDHTDRPALEASAPALLEAHSADAGRSQDVSVMPVLTHTGGQAGSSLVGPVVQARDAILHGEARAEAGRSDREGPTMMAAGPESPVKAVFHNAPEEPGAKVRLAEVAPQPGVRTQATGEARESLRDLDGGVERHTVVVQKQGGRAPGVDTNALSEGRRAPDADAAALPQEPAVEHAAGARPVDSRRWSREEPGPANARRAAGREGVELTSAKPSAAAASMPDPQEVGAARPLASDAGAVHERQAPVTARAVIDQIVQRAQLRLGRSEAEMVIVLKPDVLGRVHLRITAEPGRVVAEIRAESAVTRQLIEAGLGDLKAALADRGLDLGAIAVSGGFGAGVAWNGAKSRWSDDNPGHCPPRAAPGGGGSGAVRQVASFVAARTSAGHAHLVDCVA